VGADVDDADGPARGGKQQQAVAEQRTAIAPVERRRIEHDRKPAERHRAAGQVVTGDRFAEE